MMREVRLLVLSEGKHEIGNTQSELTVGGDLPALPTIIQRVLGCPKEVRFTCRPFRTMGRARMRGRPVPESAGAKGFASKTKQSIEVARRERFDAVIILIDRDRRPDAERLGALQRGRDEMTHTTYPQCAVGTAVETFDAWMIVDGRAIGLAGGDASKSHLEPENLDGKPERPDHPKTRALELFGKADVSDKYACVARELSLELLERGCPKGFCPFSKELEQRVKPLFPQA